MEKKMNEFENIHEKTNDLVTETGKGQHLFHMKEMEAYKIGPHYSTSEGAAVRGVNVQIVYVNKPKGTGSRLHTHPNEQFNFVIKGKLKYKVNNEEGIAGPGDLIHIPANAEHYCVTTEEEDAIYLASKDTTYFIAGDATDGEKSGAFYEEGYQPE